MHLSNTDYNLPKSTMIQTWMKISVKIKCKISLYSVYFCSTENKLRIIMAVFVQFGKAY